MLPRTLRSVLRWAQAGFLVGAIIACTGEAWFSLARDEGQELAFIVTAALSFPLSQFLAASLPASDATPYAYWFVGLVPIVNWTVLGAACGVLPRIAPFARIRESRQPDNDR